MHPTDPNVPRGGLQPLGLWTPTQSAPVFGGEALLDHARHVRNLMHIVAHPETGHLGLAVSGELSPGQFQGGANDCLWMATLPPLYPEWLGDRSFCEAQGVRFPYVAGAMARGIASADMVISMARAGMLAIFGAAGLSLERIAHDLDRIEAALSDGNYPWGANLIHSPNEPRLEEQVVELFLQRQVRTISASAFMKLTPPLVRYASTGLTTDEQGRIHRPNQIIAKVSRTEVARRFMEPPPKAMLDDLVRRGQLTETEARLAMHLPVAEDITAEADSGGHTDGRILAALLPALVDLAAEIKAERSYDRIIRIGAAGGIGTPTAAASAFALGAAYILTGSINQCSVEADVAPSAKEMLTQAQTTDVARCPSADMFEIGAQVQVLSRGTMFASRANFLGELYRRYDSLEDLSNEERQKLEKQIFRLSIDEVWQDTQRFWQHEEPEQLALAEKSPRHKMALIFRWYLGKSSRWPIDGTPDRQLDYQLWCGPAQGAFNDWARGSFLESWQQRTAPQMAFNLLEGAAVITRAHQLRTYGIHLPAQAFCFAPRPLQ